MTDKEALLFCYGALRAMSTTRAEVLNILEAHLYPNPPTEVAPLVPPSARIYGEEPEKPYTPKKKAADFE